MKKIMTIFGTRPEAIKLAPVIHELSRYKSNYIINVITAQHREMLDQTLAIFNITPDYDLNVMQKNQSLFDITQLTLEGLKPILDKEKPDMVLVQGDTTTAFIASLSAFYLKIPVGHIEAGLRTFDHYSPFPEEINRKLVGAIASQHFAPTERAKENLLRENVSGDIYVTGNTSIDSLLWVTRNTPNPLLQSENLRLRRAIQKKFILLTTHRRENFGKSMHNIMKAVQQIADSFPDIAIIFPVHLNPNVRELVDIYLQDKKNIILLNPLDYVSFAHLISCSYIVLTDSGGIQEEAPTFGKPVLVLRETTERAEGVDAGITRLVGTDTDIIVEATSVLLTDEKAYKAMTCSSNPYGNGKASQLIAKVISI